MGWERRDHHRLGRVPGLLARPRHRGRRDQGPARPRGKLGRRARDLRARGAVPLLRRRLRAVPRARRSRWRSRPRSAPTSPWSSTSARRSTPTATTRRARPSAPTAGSIAASTGTASTGPRRQAVFGIVQGGVHEDLRRESAAGRLGGRRRRDLDRRHAGEGQARDVRGARDDPAPPRRATRRSTCSGSASPTTWSRGSPAASTSSTARCRPGWRVTGWRWRRSRTDASGSNVRRAALADDEATAGRRLPVPDLRDATRAPTSTTSVASRS